MLKNIAIFISERLAEVKRIAIYKNYLLMRRPSLRAGIQIFHKMHCLGKFFIKYAQNTPGLLSLGMNGHPLGDE